MWTMNEVEEGMFVTSTDGQRIGKVIRCDSETFVVEKGTLFPKDYELRYEYIKDVKDGGIEYMLTEDLARGGGGAKSFTERASQKVAGLPGAAAAAASAVAAKTRSAMGASHPSESGTKVRTESSEGGETDREFRAREEVREERDEREELRAGERAELPSEREELRAERASFREREDQELHIPLMREEMDVEKFSRESGHVKIHKAVHVEEKHFSVPLRREELVIEHIAGGGREGALSAAAEGAFEEATMDIVLQEEDVRVGKHAVLREEVIVRKVTRAIEKDAAASLRSEDLEIEDTRLHTPPASSGYASASPTRH